MQMRHFSMDIQHSLTRFQKPGVDPAGMPVDCNQTAPDGTVMSEGYVAPVPAYDKESMFEKALTPSDVGKLNRLVIPKQFAEKYFPLGGGGGGGGTEGAAGTLLGFEDEAGKCWRFRYSYWNSSQSYVLTKGWSRYVKEKGLGAGDAVVFERHRADPDRLFIGWRRLGQQQQPTPTPALCYNAQGYGVAQDSRRGLAAAHPYQGDRRRLAGGGGVKQEGEEEEEETAVHGNGNGNGPNGGRLVRLFGVNLECQLSSRAQSSSSSSSGTTTLSHAPNPQQPIGNQQHNPQQEAYPNYFNYMGLSLPNHHLHHHHMEMEFTQTQGGGVNRLG